MESKSKVLGHALHPILVVFPLGLLVTGAVYDLLYRRNPKPETAKMARSLIGIGVVSGVVAAIPGVIDWLAIPQNTRAKRIGLWHAIGNVTQLSLFGISWLMRRSQPEKPSGAALNLSIGGLLIGNGAAWLGGELVHRLNVGNDDGANLDAPNSLSGPI